MFDDKIEFIAFEDQRHYIFILCMKNAGILDKEYAQPGMLERIVSKRLGIFGEAFESARKRLVDAELIDSSFQPVAWDKRQFLSDTSTDRVKAYRERMKRDVKQPCNVSVTAQETDTDTETEGYGETFAKSDDLCPHKSIVDIYHSTLPTARRIQEWTPARQSSLRSRWREKPERQSLEWWTKFFNYIAKSDFLCGRTSQAGRKPFEPTDHERKQVEAMSGYGLPIEQIAVLVRDGIDTDTLRKHFAQELISGKAKANAQVGKTLFQKVMAGDTTAAIWWSKTQMRWAETQKHELTGADGAPLEFTKIERVIVKNG